MKRASRSSRKPTKPTMPKKPTIRRAPAAPKLPNPATNYEHYMKKVPHRARHEFLYTINPNRKDAASILMNAYTHETNNLTRYNAVHRLGMVAANAKVAAFLGKVYREATGDLKIEAHRSFLEHHRQLSRRPR